MGLPLIPPDPEGGEEGRGGGGGEGGEREGGERERGEGGEREGGEGGGGEVLGWEVGRGGGGGVGLQTLSIKAWQKNCNIIIIMTAISNSMIIIVFIFSILFSIATGHYKYDRKMVILTA